MNENPHHARQGAARVGVDQFPYKHSTRSLLQIQSRTSVAADDRRVVDAIALQFLRLILPDHGFYVAMIKESEERKYNRFASTVSELWEIIKKADGAGHTAYHACASFREARYDPKGTPGTRRQFGRTRRNALGAKALWSDIDAGPSKPYPDWQAAAQAVAAFCRATELPRPLCVLSGLGLHIYWPLNQTLDPKTWQRYALGIKALYVKHGLQADPTRTADITSVLRVPGTRHRKHGQRMVQCGRLVGPYALDSFQTLLSTATESPPKRNTAERFQLGPTPPYLANQVTKPIAEFLQRSLSAHEPSSGALISRRCEQVRALRESRGNISEPLWYSSLGVLAFTEDGGRLAHDWSSGYPAYSLAETQARLDRARELSGPSTCARFHSLKPEVCGRCRWWTKIRSPIVLGQIRNNGRGQC